MDMAPVRIHGLRAHAQASASPPSRSQHPVHPRTRTLPRTPRGLPTDALANSERIRYGLVLQMRPTPRANTRTRAPCAPRAHEHSPRASYALRRKPVATSPRTPSAPHSHARRTRARMQPLIASSQPYHVATHSVGLGPVAILLPVDLRFIFRISTLALVAAIGKVGQHQHTQNNSCFHRSKWLGRSANNRSPQHEPAGVANSLG